MPFVNGFVFSVSVSAGADRRLCCAGVHGFRLDCVVMWGFLLHGVRRDHRTLAAAGARCRGMAVL